MSHIHFILTAGQEDARLAPLALRHQAQLLLIPHQPLGVRLNQATLRARTDWLVFAFQAAAIPSTWQPVLTELDTHLVDALMIGVPPPSLPERLLQRLLPPATPVPPYLAVSRSWLEKIGGFDTELDLPALHDLLQRLLACPTRIKALDIAFNGHHVRAPARLLGNVNDHNSDDSPLAPPPPTQPPS